MKSAIETLLNAYVSDNAEFIKENGGNVAEYIMNTTESEENGWLWFLTEGEIEEFETNPDRKAELIEQITTYVNENYNYNLLADELLEEWIVVSMTDVYDETQIRMTRRENFEEMDFCSAYGNYGVQVDCDDAGCYAFSNSSSEIFDHFYEALHTDGGFGVGSLMDDNELTYKELVEILQDPLNHANGEEIFGSQFSKMVEFFKSWRDLNENHTEVTGWTYHDSHNFRTVISEAYFGEVDCIELDEEEQIAILLQYPGVPYIEGTHASEETDDYIFHFDRWATNPWTCYVEKK
jgi:hypothetical protein